jgi:hypothetical protein
MDEPFDFDSGMAGASARREGQRRRSNREQRTRERHPRIGGLLLKLRKAPGHEQAWGSGADGEVAVAQVLAKRCPPPVLFLHDRRIPGSRANIDHVAIAPSGVWIIDAKNHKGKVEVRSPLLGKKKLCINGSDQSKLIDGLAKQVQLVTARVGDHAPVHGALCFVRADLPLLRTLKFRGYPLLYRKRLAKRLNSRGSLSPERIRQVAARLADEFPPA